MARNARKIRIAVVASGRLRVAKDVIPAAEIAKTCKDRSDVEMVVTNAAKAMRDAKPCDADSIGRLPIKTSSPTLAASPDQSRRHTLPSISR